MGALLQAVCGGVTGGVGLGDAEDPEPHESCRIPANTNAAIRTKGHFAEGIVIFPQEKRPAGRAGRFEVVQLHNQNVKWPPSWISLGPFMGP